MTKRECAIVMAYTGIVMLAGENLYIYYKYIEELFGRPVQTFEFASETIDKKIKELSKNDFLKLCKEATE